MRKGGGATFDGYMPLFSFSSVESGSPLTSPLPPSLLSLLFPPVRDIGTTRTESSGLAVKHMIDVGAGVVDADYRGPVGVVLFNFGPEDFVVEAGDRVAQLILEKVSMVRAIGVD